MARQEGLLVEWDNRALFKEAKALFHVCSNDGGRRET